MATAEVNVANKSATTAHLISQENPTTSEWSFLRICQTFQNHFPPRFFRKVFAEGIATYLLVFMTCGAAAISSYDEKRISKLGASVAGGLIVTVMIYAVGHVSGAHMNPAVTTAFATLRYFPWKQVPFYAAAQIMGSISASFTLKFLLHPIKHIGTTSPSGSDLQALLMEIVVTFAMMFVTSAVAIDTKAIGELAGLAVGSAVCISSILAGPVSGGSMNPARTLGPAIASAYYKGIWVYLVGPVVGTLLGLWTYETIKAPEKPFQVSPSPSFPAKLRRIRSDVESGLPSNKPPFFPV